MKASQIISHALKFYIREENENTELNECVYLCHAIEYNGNAIDADLGDMCNARQHIYAFLDQFACGTLHVALCRSDKHYNSYSKRYGFHSKACYTRRVKWIKELIAKLENEGL